MARNNRFEAEIGANTKPLEDSLDRAEGKIGKFGSVLGKIAGVFAVVTAAMGAAVSIMKQTESGSDRLTLITQSLKGAYQGLAATINTGDWTGLIDNITKTAKAYRDLAAAQDMNADLDASGAVQKSYYERIKQSARLAAAGTDNPALKSQYLQEAIDAQKQITAIEVAEVDRRLKAWEDFFKTKLGYDDETNTKIIANFRKLAGQEDQLWGEMGRLQSFKLQKQQLELREMLVGLSAVEKQTLTNINAQIAYIEMYKEMRDQMGAEEFNKYVLELAKMNNTMAAGDQAAVRLEGGLTAAGNAAEKAAQRVKELNTEVERADLSQFNKGGFGLAGAPSMGAGTDMLFTKTATEQVEQWKNIWMSAAKDVTNFISDAFIDLWAHIGAGNMEGWGKELLDNFGQILSQLGKMLVSLGTTMLLATTLLESPSPGTAIAAIAAGAAAMAIGGLMMGAAQKSSLSGGWGGGNASSGDLNMQALKIEVNGKISGKDIVIASKRYVADN